MSAQGKSRTLAPYGRLQQILPLLAVLAVVALVALPVRLLGEQLGQNAAASPVLTRGAARYAVIVTTRFLEVALVLAGLAVYFRLAQRPSFRELGLSRRTAPGFLAGLLLTLAALILALALAVLAGIVRPDRIQFPGPWPVLLALAAATHAAIIEELVFRGVILQVVERLWTHWGAILVSGLSFAALHIFAPFDLSPAWWVLVMAGGIGFGWVFLASGRNLWLPIGLHLGFNLGVFTLFGLPGETRGAVVWQGAPAAPALSGQAGVVLLTAAAVAAAVLVVRLRRGQGRLA